jgi:phage gp16-like protein
MIAVFLISQNSIGDKPEGQRRSRETSRADQAVAVDEMDRRCDKGDCASGDPAKTGCARDKISVFFVGVHGQNPATQPITLAIQNG